MMSLALDLNVLHAHARERASMPSRLARALASLLHEDANLRSARLGIDDTQHFRVGHERRAREHFAAVFFEEEHTVDADRVTRLGVEAVDFDDRSGDGLHLAAAALNDSEHDYLLLVGADKTLDYHGSGSDLKVYR